MYNIINLCKFNFKVSKKMIIGWTLAIFGIMFLYMILFPSIKDIAQAEIDNLPTEMLQFVGMDNISDITNYSSYFATIYNLIIIAISIFAVTFTSGLFLKEESNKSIEFLNSLPISRKEIFISKLLTCFISILLVCFVGVLSAIICGYINAGDTFKLLDILSSLKIVIFIPLIFSSITLLLIGINYNYGVSSITSMIVLISYMLGYLSKLLGTNGEFLKYFSPFELLSTFNSLDVTNEVIISLVIYLIISIISIIIGMKCYERRDFKI